MNLVLQTSELNIFVTNYVPMRIPLNNGLSLYDEYRLKPNGIRGDYKLFFEYNCKSCDSQSTLFNVAIRMNKCVEQINILFKYVTGLSIGLETMEMSSYTRQILMPNKCPKGWKSNYDDVCKSLSKNPSHCVSVVAGEVNPYVNHDQSPLVELKIAIENYPKLSQSEKDLMKLHCAFERSESIVRYAIYGKALEIVNSLYPLKSRKDTRIIDNWPDIAECFGDVTIKDLISISNNRRETRHYVSKDGAHPSMTEEERKKFYELTDMLIMNIIRQKLGLCLVACIHED